MLPGGEKVQSGGLALSDFMYGSGACLSPCGMGGKVRMMAGGEKVKTAGWVWKTAGKQKKLVLAAGIFQGLTAFGGILFALLMRRVIDAAAAGGEKILRRICFFCQGFCFFR